MLAKPNQCWSMDLMSDNDLKYGLNNTGSLNDLPPKEYELLAQENGLKI
jgi:hypothetical protein